MSRSLIRMSFILLIPILFLQFFVTKMAPEPFPAIIFPPFDHPIYDENRQNITFMKPEMEIYSQHTGWQRFDFDPYVKTISPEWYGLNTVTRRLQLPEVCLLEPGCLMRKSIEHNKTYHAFGLTLVRTENSPYAFLSSLPPEKLRDGLVNHKQWLARELSEFTGEHITAVRFSQQKYQIDPDTGKPTVTINPETVNTWHL